MRLFEFYFNPKAKSNRFFHAGSIEQKSLRNHSQDHFIYLGELNNALSQNSQFLKKATEASSSEYALSNQERFKNALKKLSEFFALQTKQGNVDWIGNLHLALVSFSQKAGQDKTPCLFSKMGSAKVLVARKGSLVDAGKDVKNIKHVGSGMVYPEDKIICMTQEMHAVFSQENILRDLVFLKEEKQFRKLFKTKQKELSRVSGILLVVLIEAPFFTKRTLSFPKEILILISFSLLLLVGYLLFK